MWTRLFPQTENGTLGVCVCVLLAPFIPVAIGWYAQALFWCTQIKCVSVCVRLVVVVGGVGITE